MKIPLARLIPAVVGLMTTLFCLPVTAAPVPVNDLVISEFRFRGPNGIRDEYVEIYNRSNSPLTVAAVDASAGFALVGADGVTRFVIPNGTVIPGHGHYLGANNSAGGYSLGSLAAPDATWTDDIPSSGASAGIALFNSSTSLVLANRLDAAGYTSAGSLYHEGAGLATGGAEQVVNLEYSFYRFHLQPPATANPMDATVALTDGEPRDTNDNSVDFASVDTNGTLTGIGQRLGLPNPKNLADPISAYHVSPNLGQTLFDTGVAHSAVPNRVRNSASHDWNVPGGGLVNFSAGILEFSRTFQNNSGVPLTELRFRVIKLTTFPTNSGTTDLRPIDAPDETLTTSGGNVAVKGTALDAPQQQFNGGGWNSTFSVPSVTAGTPLAAGASIKLRFRFGVAQEGTYRIALLAEALPGASHMLILKGVTDDAAASTESFSGQPALVVINPANSTGTSGAAFSETFTQTGGAGSITFTLNSGTLPTGLTLATSGVVSGTPTQTGTFPITVKATDINASEGVGTTYNLIINAPPSGPISFVINGTPGDATTGSAAPDAAGTDSVGTFETQVRGGFLAENGQVVFPAHLLIGAGPPAVTLNDFQGIWKDNGSGLKLLARSGSAAPETGSAVWDILPMVPAINDAGQVTFYASLRIGTGSPAVTSSDDTALWSELGGTGLGILLREGDSINGTVPGASIGAFATGAYATARINATEGSAAFSVTLKGSTTDSAILRTDVTGPAVTNLSVVAREHFAAPGTADTFFNLASGYSDPCRMDAQGNLCFAAFTSTYKQGIWYQPRGGALTKVVLSGDTAPDTGGATFFPYYMETPAMGGNGTIAFHAYLNANGDNTANDKNDGVWRGNTTTGFNCILRRGDTNASRPGLGLPSAGAKVGNLFSPWLSNANHAALTGWVDINGDGVSAFGTDAFGHFTDTDGTMKLVVKIGDAVPGVPSAVFSQFDLPVIGGQEQMAFVATFTGGGAVAGSTDSGLWRQLPNGGPLQLLIRTGDTLNTTQGPMTVFKLDFPGTAYQGSAADHRWEQQIMDATGRLVINVTYTNGFTSTVFVDSGEEEEG